MRYFLIFLGATISNISIAQEFTKLYGNTITNGGRDFIETSDDNFLIAGVNGEDAMLMKVDFNGDMLWTKNYGGDKIDEFNSVIEDNGYYYMCGSTASYTVDSITDVFVVKTDLFGNVIWSRTFGGSGCAGAYCGDQGFKIIKESSNKFVIAGLSASAASTNLMAGYILKINDSGTLLQDYVLDGVGSEFFFSVTLAENGDLIFTGQNKVGTWESWLLRMSSDGTVIYNLGYGDAGALGGVANEVLEHDGYTYMYMGNGDGTVALVKLDALGDTVTAKQYQGYSATYMLLSEDANNLYLLGNTNNATTYLLKTDLQGDTIWTKHFYNLNGHALIEKEDSIYLLAAPPSGGNGGYDVALMKMASDGSTTNCYEYDFVDFFYNPYSMVITPYGEGVSSIPYNYDVSINQNSINYNKCIKCISADFSYEVDNLEVSFTNESTLEVDYDWDFGDNNSVNNYNTSHQFSSLGSYEVCLLASDSCSSETICQTIEITECQTEPSNAIITTCDSTYGWNGENYTQSGQYVWSTINSNGCDSIATLNLTVSDLSITAELIEPNCYDSEDGAIDITYESNALPVDIHWSNGLMFEDNLNIAAGEYSVTIIDSNDCEQTETYTLSSPQELYPALNAIDASCDYTLDGMIESDVLGGTSPYQYSWNTGSTEETLTEVGTGDYSLTVIDDQDCEASADATIYYLGEGCLDITTVFTPNDDGYNDDWVINGIIDYPNCTMMIFNRWGQLLFESTGYSYPWNGVYDGRDLPIADYYYILDLQDGTEARTGTITLKR